MAAVTYSKAVNTSPYYSIQLRKFGTTAIVTLIAFVVALGFLLPFGNMALLSVKTKEQIVASADGLIWPMEPEQYTYQERPTMSTACPSKMAQPAN
jgi:ABC-type glycerol-3-phosphate transport system permease component